MPSPARRRSADDRPAPSADRYRKPVEDDEDDEDDEEESPRARRRRERDAEPVAPSTRRSRDEDDDEDEPPARRRGRASAKDDDEDDEDEEPKRPARRGSARDEEDDDDEDDDEDDAPRRKSSAGWGAFNKKRKQMGAFNNDLKVPDDDQILVKFLDDEPFASFGQHWIQTPKGLRSFICLEIKCPLCDSVGDKPRAVGAFNVLVLEEDAEPQLFVWACGPGIAQILEKKASAKTGPLSKEYYAVSKSKPKGGKGATTYIIDLVRARDLKEEWGVAPLRDAELDAFDSKMATEDKYVRYVPRAELKAVARDAMDDDD